MGTRSPSAGVQRQSLECSLDIPLSHLLSLSRQSSSGPSYIPSYPHPCDYTLPSTLFCKQMISNPPQTNRTIKQTPPSWVAPTRKLATTTPHGQRRIYSFLQQQTLIQRVSDHQSSDFCSERENPYPPVQLTSLAGLKRCWIARVSLGMREGDIKRKSGGC